MKRHDDMIDAAKAGAKHELELALGSLEDALHSYKNEFGNQQHEHGPEDMEPAPAWETLSGAISLVGTVISETEID